MAYKFKHPIRLIELFAGYGSQALALKYLNIPMEHWFVCEFDKYAMTSYNEIHGTNFEVSDIKDIKAKDLNIINTDEYKYCLTYSFPCTDLSVAGKMKGMQRESGTSSSLLWEVERLLKECDELPQYLLMENVPQVISNDNLPLFKEWTTFLSKLGYDNYYKLLNAKDFGVAQNRNRCFMISILKSEHKDFKFPKIKPLTKKMKDYLEDVVDEKYYINNDKAKALIEKLIIDGELDGNKTTCDLSLNDSESIDVANCIKARYDAGISNFKSDGSGVVETISLSNQGADYDGKIDVAHTLLARDYKGFNNTGNNAILESNVQVVGKLNKHSNQRNVVYDKEHSSPTLQSAMGTGGCQVPLIVDHPRKIGSVYGVKEYHGSDFGGTVWDKDGLAPTLKTTSAASQQFIVEEPRVVGGLGEKNSNNGTQYYQQDRVYSSDGITMCHPSSIPGGSYNYLVEEQTPISTDGKEIDVASTILSGYHRTNITGFNADNGVMEKVKIKQATEKGYTECDIGGVADLSYPDSKTRRGRVQESGQVSPTLTSCGMDGIVRIESQYRIRKLTPKECFRLMGVRDEDFNKAAYIKNDVTEEFLCYAKSKGVIERLKQKDMETYALNIISDSAEQVEILTEMKRSLKEQENEKTQNVNVAIEMLGKMERKDCAISITKCLNCMETLCILMAELDQHRTAILEWGQEDKPNTEKYMRITLEENLHPMKLYTILMAIVQIIESKIYTSMLQKVNIQGCIANYEDCEKSMVKMQISNLKMVATYTRVSSSQLYKQAGNSIVVDVLMAIFENMFIKDCKINKLF